MKRRNKNLFNLKIKRQDGLDLQFLKESRADFKGGSEKRFRKKALDFLQSTKLQIQAVRTQKLFLNSKRYKLRPDFKLVRTRFLDEIILARESKKQIQNSKMTYQELSTLLVLSLGPHDGKSWKLNSSRPMPFYKRAAASAGGLYPVDAFIIVNNVIGLPRGIYHFSALEGCLRKIKSSISPQKFSASCVQTNLFGWPGCMVIFSINTGRSHIKYGSRALRFALMEVGGIGAQMQLAATAMGLVTRYDGGGFDDHFDSILGLDGKHDLSVLRLHFGHG